MVTKEAPTDIPNKIIDSIRQWLQSFYESISENFSWKKVPKYIIIAVSITCFLVISLFPFYWLAFSSFKNLADLFDPTILFPDFTRLTLENYEFAIGQADPSAISMILNSLYISLMSVLLTMIISTLGAYAVARMRFRGKSAMTNSILLIYTFPGIIMIIPLFVLFSRLGLTGDVHGLIIAYLAQTVPVAIYMLAGYFETIPKEIEEAALMDGCSRLEVIRKVTLPLSIPAIGSISLFVFMIVWNEYLFARIFLLNSPKDLHTLTIGLTLTTAGTHFGVFGGALAAAMALLTPVMILWLLSERYLVKGLTAGAVKG